MSEEKFYRSFRITRATEVPETDERIIEGIAVPYGTITEIVPGFREQFAPNAVDTTFPLPKLFDEHEAITGIALEATNTPDGYRIVAKISDTSRGRDVWALIRDGAVDQLSVCFSALEKTVDDSAADTTLVTITRARVWEVSTVAFPAYPTATITSTRTANQKETPMPDNQPDPTAEFRDAISGLERQIATLATTGTDSAPEPFPYQSFGEFVRAAVTDPDAHTRAFNGATTTDSPARPAWLGYLLDAMTAKTPILNLFDHTTDLPAKGMSIEYGRLKSNTIAAGIQAAQGDALPLGKLQFESGSAPVVTIGSAASPISRQVIERSDAPYLTTLWQAFALAYARQLEEYTRTVFTTAATAREATPSVTSTKTLAAATATDWLGLVLDLVDVVDETVHPLDGLIVSKDVFRKLASLPEEKTALQIVGAPDNKAGTLTVNVPSASLYGLTVNRLPGWAGTHVIGYARQALKCQESPGAPLRLSDETITNLTAEFAVYGYASAYVTAPTSLHSIKFA